VETTNCPIFVFNLATPSDRNLLRYLKLQSELQNRPAGDLIIILLLAISVVLIRIGSVPAADSTSDGLELPVIFAITILGNDITSEKFILREMILKPGMIASSEALERDRLKLASLGLFNRVVVEVVEDEGRAVVLVTVTEQWYIYLFPRMRYNLNEPEEYIVGGGAYHRNFRGLGQQLTAMAWTGKERGYYFAHLDPWFGWGKNLSISWRGRFEESSIIDTLGIEHNRQNFRFGFDNRFRLSDISWIGWGIQWEEQSSNALGFTYSGSRKDRLLVESITLQRDARDYRYYPTKGALLRLVSEFNQMVDENHYFLRQSIDLRLYRSVQNLILAGRFIGVASQKDLPSYRRIGLSHSLVRSRASYKSGGGIILALNIETRFNIIPKRYYSFELFPLVKPYVQNMQFSMEGYLYFDAGCNRLTDPEEAKMASNFWAYGLGLHFQLPYVETIHFSAGWSPGQPFNEPFLRTGVGVTF